MKYDFTSIIDRRGRDAIAVDGLKGDGFSPAPPKEGFDAIPMWVAAKALAFAATALVIQRLPRPPSLSEASMATGRLLSVASISMISALRSTLMAFRNWRRLSA